MRNWLPLDPDRKELPEAGNREQVEINIRYEGYIQRQKKQVSQFEKLENGCDSRGNRL